MPINTPSKPVTSAGSAKLSSSPDSKPETAVATEPKVVVDRAKYKDTRSASGAKSLNNGDPVAVAMEGMNIDEVYTLAKGVTGEDYKEKYTKLNLGMQRMNLGNRIRGSISKINKAGAAVENGNPKGGDEKFAAAAKPIVEAVKKRIEGEAAAKKKVAAEKQIEADRKAKEAKDKKDKADRDAAAKKTEAARKEIPKDNPASK